jgi:hypothetical protein
MEVAEIYIKCAGQCFLSSRRVGAKAGVSPSFAEKAMHELVEIGHVLDPELLKQLWNKARDIRSCLTTEMEIFLLALR